MFCPSGGVISHSPVKSSKAHVFPPSPLTSQLLPSKYILCLGRSLASFQNQRPLVCFPVSLYSPAKSPPKSVSMTVTSIHRQYNNSYEDGLNVGGTDGAGDGDGVGSTDGFWLGDGLGIREGLSDGMGVVGSLVGLGDGIRDGLELGIGVVGNLVGLGVGKADGIDVGDGLGINEGLELGIGVAGD